MSAATDGTGSAPSPAEAEPAYTLLLVDDQPEFFAIDRSRLRRDPRLVVVAEASSGQDAVARWPSLSPQPSAALIDVEMPGLDGFQTARKLTELAPGLKIVLVSGSDERAYASLAATLGAGFLAKRSLAADAVLRLLDAAAPHTA